MSGVQARRPPSHRQRAPPPFLLDSSTSLHTPVYPHITPSWSQSVAYLYISPPSLCLARLPYPHSLVYVFVVFCVGYCTDYIRFVRSGHQHYVAVWGVPFLITVLFCLLAFEFIIKMTLPALGPRSRFFLGLQRGPVTITNTADKISIEHSPFFSVNIFLKVLLT